MCGIFGVITKNSSFTDSKLIRKTFKDLFLLSESRGKESSGLAALTDNTIWVYKQSVAASTMVTSDRYKKIFNKITRNDSSNEHDSRQSSIALMGHSRLVTNGVQEIHDNNQPVIKDGIIGIHNGIIVNDSELWLKFPNLQRHYDVDTEVILSLIRYFYNQTGSLLRTIRSSFQLVEGTASVAILFTDLDVMAIATNNGSLYTCTGHDGETYLFASEEYILRQLIKRRYLHNSFKPSTVTQVRPGFGFIIDITDINKELFSLNGLGELNTVSVSNGASRAIVDITAKKRESSSAVISGPTIIPESIFKRFSIDSKPIQALRRCTRCVLPETMPFIQFDEEGVCNYCHTYQKHEYLGEESLLEFVDRYRSKNGRPDCIVTFSGGRDSSYCLHYVTNVLKMNPIAYTYDWGMITDLARRNQARLCGKLGVEQILISADITEKRKFIRKNVTAWLKRPHLGTVPLFMAGDKQYFYYANKLRQQTGVDLIILAANPMEKTQFKSGFCGVQPSFTHIPSLLNLAKLASFYAKEYIFNPAYLNDSLFDTLWAFLSYYMIPHNYLRLYRYIKWDENVISSTLLNEYDWEVATDTQTTWRIGDGTASFYNYIYYTVGGFTENDTFHSNQIREGMISREKAMEIVNIENQPRFESIQWYCNTIGIDMESALERIISIPRLYPLN